DEEEDRHQEGDAQATLLDNGTQRGADQEHGNTGKRTGDDLVPLDPEDEQIGMIACDLGVVGTDEVLYLPRHICRALQRMAVGLEVEYAVYAFRDPPLLLLPRQRVNTL